MTTFTPNTSAEKLDVSLPEEGAYPARLISIVHLWTTTGRFWPQTQCIMRFELPTETAIFVEWWDELPHTVNVYVSVTNSPKWAFVQVLNKLWVDTNWAFEIEDALWKTCQISVFHKESNWKVYLNAKRKDIAKLMKWTKVPKQFNESKFFWFSADYDIKEWKNDKWEKTFTKTACKDVVMTWWDWLNDYEQEKVAQSREYKWLKDQALEELKETMDDNNEEHF